MIGETYELTELEDRRAFIFFSDGPKGNLPKVVLYSPIPGKPGTYNLGFGDFQNGMVDDKSISNNSDLLKIMNTVAKTVYLFTDVFPQRKIYIEPVDEKRSRLYHAIFQRRWGEIQPHFEVKGLTEQGWIGYEANRQYLAFELKRKLQR